MTAAKVVGLFYALAFLAMSSSHNHLQAEGCLAAKNIVMHKDGCYNNIEKNLGDQLPKEHSYCCQTVAGADVRCICSTFTEADKAKISLSKWVNVARACDNPLPHGTNCAGRGGSGIVYKGILDDERVVAVKVLRNVSRQSEKEFRSELSVIGRIYHMNLVRMWGCCSQGKHKILVSEYIENGSLAQKLFDKDGSMDMLDWNQRFRIALGVAKWLAYLHSECSESIVHCDMKREIILLDKDLEPKITDFGLSKLLNRDGSDATLTRISGTRGYMALEWVSNLPVTEKLNIYSYGVMLLELLKGIRISEWVIHGIKNCKIDTRMVVRATREKMEPNHIWHLHVFIQ
uniref:non-specific serine/threonine protein kinase n=1 Tax=Leersia perrieri TaxID=77586 RepID=A0A0D9XWL0_9ORYZ